MATTRARHGGGSRRAVFDGKSQELLRDVDIKVDRGRIRSVEPHRDDLHVGRVIDASTETVMPGLIDMHAHLESGYGEALGRLWLWYGITTVRHRQQRNELTGW